MAADPAPLVLVTSRSFGSGDADPEADLTEAGLRVVHGDASHDLDALRPDLADALAWIAGAGPVRADHLDHAPALRIVARYGTGVDTVDLEAARARGVVVTNTPGANADAVADHTLTLLLACLRQVVDADRALRHGDTSRRVGRELSGLTVGLIGLGRVGQAVATRLTALHVTVLGHDPAVEPGEAAAFGVGWRDLDEFIQPKVATVEPNRDGIDRMAERLSRVLALAGESVGVGP
jgi:D-3-phosphoglycerate dehydrogenase / 2-oxoglutarate reductase